VWASGLTSVTGCGFGPDGQFYAVEFSNKPLLEAAPGTGEVVRVPPHSTSPTPIVEHLSFPGGFAANSWNNSGYISNWIVAPADGALGGATGEVLRIALPTSGYACNGGPRTWATSEPPATRGSSVGASPDSPPDERSHHAHDDRHRAEGRRYHLSAVQRARGRDFAALPSCESGARALWAMQSSQSLGSAELPWTSTERVQ